MKNLSYQDKKILLILYEYPQGISLSQTQKLAEIGRKEYALYYLKKLMKKGWVRKTDHLYFFQGDINLVQSSVPITTKPKSLTQRPHRLQTNAFLFRTSWDRLEPTLQSLSIPYKKELKQNMIRFNYMGIELRATRQYLYRFIEMPEEPINLPLEEIKLKAIQEVGAYLESFLNKTGLRCKRDRLGRLAIEIHYWENGYPGNEIAEESLKDKTRIVYAYDKEKPDKPIAWADSSLGDLKELETNSEIVDTQMKLLIQATENGELKPYEDEIKTRRDIEGLLDLANQQAIVNAGTQQLVLDIKEELKIHRSAYQALEKVAKRLDDTLRQRRL